MLTPLSPSALLTRKEEFSKSGFGASPEAQAAVIPGCAASAPLSEEPTSDTWVSELGETKSALQLPEVLGLRGRLPPPRGRIGPTNRSPERGGGGARAWRGGAGLWGGGRLAAPRASCAESAGLESRACGGSRAGAEGPRRAMGKRLRGLSRDGAGSPAERATLPCRILSGPSWPSGPLGGAERGRGWTPGRRRGRPSPSWGASALRPAREE